MLNYIWLGLVLLAVLLGGITGRMKEVTEGAFTLAETAVMKIALPLIGIMALWLGIMRLAEQSGLIQILARALRPVMTRLFPDVPPEHPAMGSMLMNMAANMLGLANAATPLGLRAMRDLERLNPHPGTATNAMCTFLAINTSSIQLIPMTAVGILVAAKAREPYAIIGTAFLATICATFVGIAAVKWLEKLPMFRAVPFEGTRNPATDATSTPVAETEVLPEPPRAMPGWGRLCLIAFAGFFLGLMCWQAFTPLHYEGVMAALRAQVFPGEAAFKLTPDFLAQNPLVRAINTLSLLAVPFLLAFFPLYAALRGVKVYEEFVEGAKEGFGVATRIIPFLVAILIAIGMFRGAGGIELLQRALSPILTPLGFPSELLPISLIRSLSGSASIGLFTELVQRLGPDHLTTQMAATIFGSSETTFYVIAVYFGAVAIRRTRHAIAAGLLADLAGVIASIAICRMVLG